MSGLFMDLRPGDTIRINGDTFLTLEKKSGQSARLRFVGPTEVELMRSARQMKQTALNLPAATTGD